MSGHAGEPLDDIFHYVSAGRLDEAEALCRQSLTSTPDDMNVLGMLGAILLKTGRTDEAEVMLQRAISLAPGFAKPYEDLGLLNLDRGEFEKALACFEKALALDSGLRAAQRGLTVALHRLDRTEEAKDAAIRHGILSPAAQSLAEADRLRKEGRTEQAENVCQALLAREPENLAALRLMAVIASDDERYVVAEGLLRRLLSLQPDSTAARRDLGRFLGERSRFPEAIEVLEAARAADPAQADIECQLGDLLAIVGRSEAALEAYERCLSLAPDEPAALIGRGHMLRILGRRDEAVVAYRRSLAVAPDNGDGWWNLASLHNYRIDDDAVSLIRSKIDNPELPDESRIGFHFALGRALEQRQDYPGAWARYQLGNSAKRALVRYDPVEIEMQHRSLQELFVRDFFDTRQVPAGGRTPVFVVGLPRSGSTLIEQILASHSDVEGGGELPYIVMLSRSLGTGRAEERRYPEILASMDASQLAALGKTYHYHAATHCRAGTPYFTDKMPANFSHVGLIRLMLPQAKIIDARRDPMATCVANFRTLFAKGKNHSYDLTELGEYYLQYLSIMEHWDTVLPGAVLRVQYEDVVANLEVEVRRILEFCDLPFEDACLRYHESKRPVNTASSEQVRQAIYDSSVEFWRNYEPHLDELREVLAPAL